MRITSVYDVCTQMSKLLDTIEAMKDEDSTWFFEDFDGMNFYNDLLFTLQELSDEIE